jgi:D-alanyl-lipoteichoic acid acyltransferase DltB (MBOAT superfamily)
MLFPTVEFGVFFVIVFTGNWLLRPFNTAWRWFILAASCYFYNYWNYGRADEVYLQLGPLSVSKYLVLFLFIVAMNWALGEGVLRSVGPDGEKTGASRQLVKVAVVANLLILGYFKYTNFFLDSTVNVVGAGWSFDDIILPIGISFIVFQAMGYVIDLGRGVEARLSLLDMAVYLTFFAHVLAGPIVRATEFGPQIHTNPDPRRVEYAEAFNLIFRGLFKKVVVSSYLANQIVDPVFANPELYGRWSLLFAVYGFAIQIYCDFSGYTDIAIGCALLLGIRFPQNFDAPYIARSVQDFWRRWHITLSRWLRDYLYIPLGGNRKGDLRTYLNLFLTMFIGGFWHGASWTMLAWGAIHGIALAVERVVKERWKPLGLPAPLVASLQWLLTFNVVCFAWIFFRASAEDDKFGTATTIISGILAPVGVLVLVAGLVAVAVVLIPTFLRIGGVRGPRRDDEGTPVGPGGGGATTLAPAKERSLTLGMSIGLGAVVGVIVLLVVVAGLPDVVGSSDAMTLLVAVAIVGSIASHFVPPSAVRKAENVFTRLPVAVQAIAVGLAFLLIDALGPEGVPEFIYFQF